MLVTLVETEQDCLKKLFTIFRTTRWISEFIGWWVSDRWTSNRKLPDRRTCQVDNEGVRLLSCTLDGQLSCIMVSVFCVTCSSMLPCAACTLSMLSSGCVCVSVTGVSCYAFSTGLQRSYCSVSIAHLRNCSLDMSVYCSASAAIINCCCCYFFICFWMLIRPLSDTVPLWSGSSCGAFVYVGNDGCMFCSWLKHNNRKDKCRFLWLPSNTKEYKKWEDSVHQILISPKIID